MVVVTLKHLHDAAVSHRDAAKELTAWQAIVEMSRWRNLAELQAAFPDADYVNGYVVFNIRHNRYRMVTVVHFAKDLVDRKTQGHVYIRSFLTHKEYQIKRNWDPFRTLGG